LTAGVRVVAVDWSGRAGVTGQRRHIWRAVADDGRLVALGSGMSRGEVVDEVVAMARADEELIVGFDFAFSFPAWFVLGYGLTEVGELWALAAVEGERWLEECRPPFWGRPHKPRPALVEQLRLTDASCQPVGGARPKSVFQVGGAGAVGTGSIRGMPYLPRLRAAGFSVWPFDPAGSPLVVEIYPRALTGPVRKSVAAARAAYLEDWTLPLGLRRLAQESEDAFDAAASALVMWRHLEQLRNLCRAEDPRVLLEGAIWAPTP
jgi:hypothetical protein